MTVTNVIVAAISIGLFAYLLYALLAAEEF